MLPAEALLAALARSGRGAGRGAAAGLQVLDLCAAPGSKATQLGAWLADHSGSLLVANEVKPRRAQLLRANVLRAGLTNVMLTNIDGRDLGDLAPEAFDAVLLDAPCSGEGNIRKDTAVLQRWCCRGHEQQLASCVQLQWDLLDSAWKALRPGGCLVYSTCTLNADENEAQCRRLIQTRAEARLVNLGALMHLPHFATNEGFLRCWPQTLDCEGFFVGCFIKESSIDLQYCSTGSDARPAAAPGPPPGGAGGAPAALRPLSGEAAEALRREAAARRWRPPGAGRLAEAADGGVWLLPPPGLGLERLAALSPEPGVPLLAPPGPTGAAGRDANGQGWGAAGGASALRARGRARRTGLGCSGAAGARDSELMRFARRR